MLKGKRLPYIICFISLLVRLIHIAEISGTRPFYQELYNDAKVADQWGREIAAGDILGRGVPEQDPLYAYFIGLIYSVFGHNILLVILIQAFVGSLSSLLVFYIGKRLFNQAVGIMAALLWSFHPIIIFYEGVIMKEGLAVFLMLFALYTIFLARDTRYRRYWLLGGVFTGLSALTRGNILFVIPFIFLWMIAECKKDLFKTAAIFLLGLVIIFIPVATRNKIVVGEFALSTSRSGINFYWGNNETARGSNFPAPRFIRTTSVYELGDFKREAERVTGKEMSNSDISRFWLKKGLDFISEHPSQYIRLQYQKLRLLFNEDEFSDNYQYSYYKRFSHIVNYSPANFLLIASLGLLGMVLSIRNWKGLSLLYIFTISYSLSIIIFFVISRYRLPMTPVLAIFAASALYWFWMKVCERRYLILLPSIALLSLFAAFVGKDIPWLTDLNRHEVLYREGFDFETKGDYDRAEAKYMEAARISPQSYAAHFGLGEVYTVKKRPHAAANEYRLAVQAMPMSALAHFKLGMAYIDTGSFDEAIREFQASIELVSGQPQSYYGLGAAFDKKGMPDEAVRYLEGYLRREPEGEFSATARNRIEALRGRPVK